MPLFTNKQTIKPATNARGVTFVRMRIYGNCIIVDFSNKQSPRRDGYTCYRGMFSNQQYPRSDGYTSRDHSHLYTIYYISVGAGIILNTQSRIKSLFHTRHQQARLVTGWTYQPGLVEYSRTHRLQWQDMVGIGGRGIV